jgi:hypothetical protein
MMCRAEVTNTTIEETDPRLKYTGVWGNNSSPFFSGGGTTFTNEDNASVSLKFNGKFLHSSTPSLGT